MEKDFEKEKAIKDFFTLIIIALVNFIFFTLYGNFIEGGFGTQTLSFTKTLKILSVISPKVILIYFISHFILYLSFKPYSKFFNISNYWIPYSIYSIFVFYLFIFRQAVYTPGFIETYIEKTNIPFFTIELLLWLSNNIAPIVFDILIAVFVIFMTL